MENATGPDQLILAGYLGAFQEGFALPCYISNPSGNAWYAANCSTEGDHNGIITGFEIFCSDEIKELPVSRQICVNLGDPWQDIFLWNNIPYVGLPSTIIRDLHSELDNIRDWAPISLLDLALAAGETNVRPILRNALESITRQYGKRTANTWFRDVFICEQARLNARRRLGQVGNIRQALSDTRKIKVTKTAGQFFIDVPPSVSSALEVSGQLTQFEEKLRYLSEVSETELKILPANRRTQSATASTAFSDTSMLEQKLAEYRKAAETSAKMAENMRMLAHTDTVTGLSNRAGFNHELEEKITGLKANHKLALFWLDLNQFKEINNILGHPTGDRVLTEVAKRLREEAPSGSTVSRFGGDEFLVATEVRDRPDSERFARNFLASINRSIDIEGEMLELSGSLGIALLPDDGTDLDSLMKCADLALYHAKVEGKNGVRFFQSSMTRDLVRRKEIEIELRAAIERDNLSIFFQPIVDLESGRIRSFEALIRWFHPEKGEMRPDEFLPVAEETGAIVKLENWVITEAAKAASQWPPHITIAVNLSPCRRRPPNAARDVLSALEKGGLDPSRLELEVPESFFLYNQEHISQFVSTLAAEGVRFVLDDFGTGYSSLGQINTIPFSKIKVDRSFVSGPHVGRKSDAIIRAIAEMGATLEIDIVAEGLETIEQVRSVRSAGCTLGQGYYFSRAVPDYLADGLLEKDGERYSLPASSSWPLRRS